MQIKSGLLFASFTFNHPTKRLGCPTTFPNQRHPNCQSLFFPILLLAAVSMLEHPSARTFHLRGLYIVPAGLRLRLSFPLVSSSCLTASGLRPKEVGKQEPREAAITCSNSTHLNGGDSPEERGGQELSRPLEKPTPGYLRAGRGARRED